MPLSCFVIALALLAGCTESPAPAPSGLHPDTTVFRDGDRPRMNSPTRERLIAQDPLWADALRLHYDALVMDGHVDTPSLMLDEGYRLGERHHPLRGSAHLDLPRMEEGGLDAPFFSIFVSRRYGETPAATARALDMIAEADRQIAAHIERVALARSAEDVRRITASGRKAVLYGLEGGHALQASEAVLQQLYDAGIRYVTLTHTASHSWADSSQDEPRNDGLSAQGEALVRAMNRLGVLVDLSHVSDATVADALRVTEAPVIASHSSARTLVDNVRNLSDEQLRAIAEGGGVVLVNFFDPVVNGALTEDVMAAVYRRVEREHSGDLGALWTAIRAERRARGLRRATLDDVLDHIEHIARVAGPDHIGLGSDFDGVPALPEGLGDVTRLPWITYGLLQRGWSESDIRKVLGLNLLRVMDEAERVARSS